MKRITLIFILFLGHNLLFGNTISELKNVLKKMNFVEVDSFLKSKTDTIHKIDDVWNLNGTDRIIDSTLTHRKFIFSIIEDIYDKSYYSLTTKDYLLDVIFNSDSVIVYYRLSKTDNRREKIEEILSIGADTLGFNEIYKAHNNLYRTSVKTQYEYPPFIETQYYGHFCYYGGVPTPLGEEMLKFVNNRAPDSLVQMVLTFNYEIKAYGVCGLYMLDQLGYDLTEEHKDLIKITQNSDVWVNVCRGCVFGRAYPLKYELKNETLNRVFLKYIDREFIK